MNPWFLLTVMSLTVYRCTRLIVRDTLPPVLWLRDRLAGGWRPLTERERDEHLAAPRVPDGPFGVMKLADSAPAWMKSIQSIDYEGSRGTQESRYVVRPGWVPYWLAELWSCPWCVSGWIAGVVTAATDVWVGLPAPVLCGFAAWALGALLASQEGT